MATVTIGGRRLILDEEVPQPTVKVGNRHLILDDGSSKSSALGAFGRSALEAAAPTATGVGAAAALTPVATAAAPATFGLSFLLPIAGGLATAYGASRAQDITLRKLIPEKRETFLRQRTEDIKRHPVATTAGEFLPALLTLKPRIPTTAAALRLGAASGGIQAGLEAGAELATEGRLRPERVATSGILGSLLTKPTRFGARLFPTAAEVTPGPSSAEPMPARLRKIVTALEEAAPVRGEQEVLATVERGKRLARLLGIRKELGGEAGFRAEKAQLMGELPKVQFESIRQIEPLPTLRPVTSNDLGKNVQFTTKVGDKVYTERGQLLSFNENTGNAIVKLTEIPEYYSQVARKEWEKYGPDILQAKTNTLSAVEFPKAVEKSATKLSQTDIDGLFDDVNSSRLDPWNQVTAKAGLAKLLQTEGGQVPTQGELNFLGQVFGPQFVKAILQKRPLLEQWTRQGIRVLNTPRAIMASMDLSAPLRQGLFLIGRPKQWIPAFTSMFKQFTSESAFQTAQESIRSRPTYPLMKQARLSLTEIGESFTTREEAFMSSLAENIPVAGKVVHASNRGYVGFLNKLRADTFDDFMKKGQQLGIAEDPGFARSVAKYVNAATGRGELGRFEPAAVALNTVFFSPRLLASRFSLLNPLFYARLHPMVRQRALTDALTMTSAGLSILGLAKLNGVEVGTDPRSSDFGKLKVGNTRYDLWGGFQQPIVALARLLTGETASSTTGRVTKLTGEFGKSSREDILFRFLQSKQAPVLSFITTMLRGQTIGRGPADVSSELVDRFIPIFLQDLFDVAQEHGVARGWMTVPGAFGVGMNTYGNLIPQLKETPSGRVSVGFRDRPTLGEEIVNRLQNRPVTTLPPAFHEPLARAKRLQSQRKIHLKEAKDLVRRTGRSVQVGNSRVFRDRSGIIHVQTRGRVVSPERTLQTLLQTLGVSQ